MLCRSGYRARLSWLKGARLSSVIVCIWSAGRRTRDGLRVRRAPESYRDMFMQQVS